MENILQHYSGVPCHIVHAESEFSIFAVYSFKETREHWLNFLHIEQELRLRQPFCGLDNRSSGASLLSCGENVENAQVFDDCPTSNPRPAATRLLSSATANPSILANQP